jgi:hypothetical protein
MSARLFSFCESSLAGPLAPWHIRRLTSVGRKSGGGIDTPSLCGHVKPFATGGQGGWDLDFEIEERHLMHACRSCVAKYRVAIAKEGGG